MMKKICLFILCILLVGCQQAIVSPSEDPGACSFGESEDCEKPTIDVKEDLKWEVISFAQSKEMLTQSVVLFYSFADCPYCEEVKPVLEEVSTLYPDVQTYYVDVQRSERESGQETYDELFEIFKPYLAEEGYEKLYMPYVVFVKDGEIVLTKTSTTDDVKEMDEAQTKALYDLYLSGYQKIAE